MLLSYYEAFITIMIIHLQASAEDHSNLCLLLNIVDLLATCCAGEFLRSEVIAEGVFSLEEILG